MSGLLWQARYLIKKRPNGAALIKQITTPNKVRLNPFGVVLFGVLLVDRYRKRICPRYILNTVQVSHLMIQGSSKTFRY